MPGKKGMIIGIPVALLILGGGFYGAAVTGFLKIPGITPKSKMGKHAGMYGESGTKMYGEAKDTVAEVKPKPRKVPETPKPTPKPTHTTDPAKGAAAVAEVWNGIETPQLVEIAKDWKDSDLALVLSNMDASKAGELLAAMEPKRASKISEEIQVLASKVPIAEN